MKRKNLNTFKGIFTLFAVIIITLTVSFGVSAEDVTEIPKKYASGDYADESVTEEPEIIEEEVENNEILGEGGENSANFEEGKNNAENSEEDKGSSQNIFEDIYKLLELNADKIFSVLAFVGTIVVSVGYKSGLLPLLRDALSKLKGAIDGVKADGEISKALTESKMSEMSEKIAEINSAIEKNNGELKRIEWQFENYEQLMAERESMRLILQGQIDMLYAIFMSSALPQYQKEEIGTKIQEMREELASYEESVEK